MPYQLVAINVDLEHIQERVQQHVSNVPLEQVLMKMLLFVQNVKQVIIHLVVMDLVVFAQPELIQMLEPEYALDVQVEQLQELVHLLVS